MRRIGVLRGGVGEHYDSSLFHGGNIINFLKKNLTDKYKTIDILVDKEGVWHIHGMPVLPHSLMHRVDAVWDTAGGTQSGVFKTMSIPHIGVSPFFSALVKNKILLRDYMKSLGVNMPKAIVLPLYQEDFDGPLDKYAIKKAKEVHAKFGAPWVVRSFTPDVSMGVHVAKTFGELVSSIEDGVRHQKSILVEELIMGKVGSVHSVNGFRSENIYAFPPTASLGNFTVSEKEKINNLAKSLHEHLDVKAYLKSDFVLHPSKGIYILNFDFLPDLREDSHLQNSCESVGAKMNHVVEQMLENVTR